MQQYEIARNSHTCCVSGKDIKPGDRFYSAVLDTVTGLERKDYLAEHWSGPPEDAVAFWRGRVPEEHEQPKPKTMSPEAMLELFERWPESDEPEKQQLRYVLTLLLIRKKALKLNTVESADGVEYLIVGPRKSKETYRVRDAQLSETQIEQLEEQLHDLLAAADDAAEPNESSIESDT